VGKHPAFPEIARRAAAVLTAPAHASLTRRLMPGNAWGALTFVDVCEEAAHPAATESLRAILREIQRVEFEVLVERFARAPAER
jgi:low temperature requirement protein LtrA